MKPSKSILDESFTYVSSAATSVRETWRRFGWRPAFEDERKNVSLTDARLDGQANREITRLPGSIRERLLGVARNSQTPETVS